MAVSSSSPSTISCPTTNLFDLPPELFRLITPELSPYEIAALRLTCRSGPLRVPSSAITAARRKLVACYLTGERAVYSVRKGRYDLLLKWVNVFPNQNMGTYWSSDSICNIHANHIMRAEHLMCYSCLVMLPWQCFTRKQRMGPRSFGHKDASKRFCMHCAARKAKWVLGTEVLDELGRLVLCVACKQVKRVETGSPRNECCSDCRSTYVPEPKKDIKKEPGSIKTICLDADGQGNCIKRSNRCQRCWAINHTTVASSNAGMGTPLCIQCLTANHLAPETE